jgi:hypothetical protein
MTVFVFLIELSRVHLRVSMNNNIHQLFYYIVCYYHASYSALPLQIPKQSTSSQHTL